MIRFMDKTRWFLRVGVLLLAPLLAGCASTPTPLSKITNSIGMTLVYIPPGEFLMGSPKDEPDRDEDETQHRVRLTKGFYLGATEVTQAQWKAVMGEKNNPSRFQGDDLPVECVSWDDAVEFCRKLSEKEAEGPEPRRGGKTYRLPTEAEWEYACRAGSRTRFSFGESDGGLAEYAWCSGTGGTHPVARKKPNAWGLYDMHGNVWEWCSDWLGPYAAGRAVDPQGPASGSQHVLRGGAWGDEPQYCRCAHRRSNVPGHRDQFDGFRVVVPVGGVDLK